MYCCIYVLKEIVDKYRSLNGGILCASYMPPSHCTLKGAIVSVGWPWFTLPQDHHTTLQHTSQASGTGAQPLGSDGHESDDIIFFIIVFHNIIVIFF